MHLLRRGLAVVALLTLSMGVSGCSEPSETADAAATTAASAVSPELSESGEVSAPDDLSSQTLWRIEGTEEAIPDDDPDVQAVRTLVTVHSGAVDNRDPKTVERALEDEYAAYTPRFSAVLDGVDWRSTSIVRTVHHGVVSQQVGIAWLQSSISVDRSSATAQYECYIVFTAGDDAFFEDNEIERGREYSISRLVEAEKLDGIWLISDVRESSLRPRGDSDD